METAPTNDEQQWPPKSPHQALLSSPSGRKKWQQRQRHQASPSPSPTKRPPSASKTGSRARMLMDDDMDEDEDEETLQLKLQAIEARLKLKKLQSSKAKQGSGSEADSDGARAIARPGASSTAERNGSRTSHSTEARSSVQVPLSPPPSRRAEPQAPTSPARILLGIDKGLRAQDVSLKRPAISRDRAQTATYGSRRANLAKAAEIKETARPKSFSERLLESRTGQKEKEAKEERIRNTRTRGFGINTRDDGATGPRASSQQSSDSTASRVNGRSNTNPEAPPSSSEDTASIEPFSGIHLSKRLLTHSTVTRAFADKELYTLPRLLHDVKGPDYEPPDVEGDYVVLGVIASKSDPRNTKMNNKIASTGDPDEAEAENRSKFMVIRLTDFKWEIDLFLFGTAFSSFWKLTPGTLIAIHDPSIMPPRNRATGQFSLKLGSSEDTILEIGQSRDLGFCKAIKKDGQECGAWIDKRKTEYCEFHVSLQVDKAKRGRMEVNTMVGFGKDPKSKNSRGGGRFGGGRNRSPPRIGQYHDKYLHETAYILPASMSRRSAKDLIDADEDAMSRGMSREELARKRRAEKEKERELAEKLGQIGSGGMGSEYMRAKGAASASSSSKTVGPPGATPHPRKTRDTTAAADEPTGRPLIGKSDVFARPGAGGDMPPPPDAAALGLLGKKASNVTLSPVKRKRSETGTAASSSRTHNSEPMGWGGASKAGLLSPTRKVVGQGIRKYLNAGGGGAGGRESREGSPKKRARLMIEGKGERFPGRDSLPGQDAMDVDEDDDDLEII
ncbi:hypothetical protein K490DRAFT_47744 [Saccharata proteae CBS 121410]|uniref:Zinc finger Mcm10/DnaG-type domain-containing protein n=1 Tax=Saccharata proteae CBS 121410 TaxID=1314787 RepID=A0A9P4LWE1_9PEZI|nr:hypothetical protein K490DRAFT_47744 [Saccharata proteae CBS 121410]